MSDKFKSLAEVIAFLRSCIASGETVSAEDYADIDRALNIVNYVAGVRLAHCIQCLQEVKDCRCPP